MRGSAVFRTGVAPGGALAGPWVRNPLWTRARAVPSLDLRFADNKSLVDAVTGAQLVTFTRASSGTFVGSDGVLRTAVTNLCLQSENFTTTWTNFLSTDAANTAIAPNGTLTADTLIPDSGATAGLIRQDFSGATFTDNASISFSIYVKAAGLTNFNIQFYNKANTFHGGQTVNASTGALSGVGTLASTAVTSIGDGWYRVSMTGMSSGTGATGPNLRIVVTSTGDGTSGLFLWGAQLEQSSTVGEYIPTTSAINSAPRFDHNPTTGESLGLLVEEARTNSITNNTMVGAVAGTPGTLPTGWNRNVTQNGITQNVAGVGVINGISYVDIRFQGTATGSGYTDVAMGSATAAQNQTWAFSAYLAMVGGSTANMTAGALTLYGSPTFSDNGSVTWLSTIGSNLTANSRFSAVRTFTNVLTNSADFRLTISATAGAAVDITIRIGLPQLEQGAFTTSPILTSTATATRAADVASVTGTNFSSWYNQTEGTVFAEGAVAQPNSGGNQFVFRTSDNGYNNSVALNIQSGGFASIATASGGVFDGVATSSATLIANTTAKFAGAYATNNLGVSLNGATVATDTSATMPTALNRLDIGSDHIGSNRIKAGTIKRLTYWPTRLSTIQQITQP